MSRSQSQSSFSRGTAARPPPTPLIHQHRRLRSRSVRPSLLGAIEFADVVNSLASDQSSAANVLSVFGGAHQHHAHSHDVLEDISVHSHDGLSPKVGRRRAHSQPGPLQLEGNEDTLANSVLRDAERRNAGPKRSPLGPRRWTADRESTDVAEPRGIVDLSKGVDDPWRDARSPLSAANGHARSRSAATVPSIHLTSENGSDTVLGARRSSSAETIKATPSPSLPAPSKRQIAWALVNALFPSMQSFVSKSIVGKTTALLCVPALFALNLTLPVAEEPPCDENCEWTEEKGGRHADDSHNESDADDTAVERIGRTLRSPATAASPARPHGHGHDHDHDASSTHRLQHLRAEGAEADAPSPSLAWGEVTRDPLEPLNLGSPAVALQQNPLEEFGVVQNHDRGDAAQQYGSATEDDEEEAAREIVTRSLTAVQCALGPVFVVTALSSPFHFSVRLCWRGIAHSPLSTSR